MSAAPNEANPLAKKKIKPPDSHWAESQGDQRHVSILGRVQQHDPCTCIAQMQHARLQLRRWRERANVHTTCSDVLRRSCGKLTTACGASQPRDGSMPCKHCSLPSSPCRLCNASNTE